MLNLLSKAEDVLGKTLLRMTSTNNDNGNDKNKVVAIVDPPRSGLH